MNPRLRHLGFAALLVAAVFFFGVSSGMTGCAAAPDGSVTLPAMPAWKAPRVERAEFAARDVLIHAGALLPGVPVDLSDSTFSIVNHETMLDLLRWSDAVYRATGHGYTAESWDCDKFAKAYTLAVEWCASKAGIRAQPLAARVYVDQVRAFGGVLPGGQHAIAGVRTDRGYFVLEPQPGNLIGVRVVPLDKFPNRIFRIKIGG